jgi:hypothetical protein
MRRSLVVAALALASLDCKPKPKVQGTPVERTQAWFDDNKSALERSRAMIEADRGKVTDVELAGLLSGLHGAGGARGICESHLRGGDFPWGCRTGGVESTHEVKNMKEVAAWLGVSEKRLKEYERTLPVSVGEGGSCGPPGSIRFYLSDPDNPPCVGLNEILWSPTPIPPGNKPPCARTVETTYLPLAPGWYQDACR